MVSWDSSLRSETKFAGEGKAMTQESNLKTLLCSF